MDGLNRILCHKQEHHSTDLKHSKKTTPSSLKSQTMKLLYSDLPLALAPYTAIRACFRRATE